MHKIFSEKTFSDEVLKSDRPVLVDFYAEWCGPCKMLGPVIEELSEELADKMLIGKVDIDKDQNLAQQYGIMSVPTLLVFVNGEVVEKFVGAMPKAQLQEKLTRYI